MAAVEKTYAQPSAVLLNLVNDIVEMRKAKITHSDGATLVVNTDMYGIKTEYRFHVASRITGTSVTIETEGEDDHARRRVELMCATLENMLIQFAEVCRENDPGI